MSSSSIVEEEEEADVSIVFFLKLTAEWGGVAHLVLCVVLLFLR
jgi:hypothetical protein